MKQYTKMIQHLTHNLNTDAVNTAHRIIQHSTSLNQIIDKLNTEIDSIDILEDERNTFVYIKNQLLKEKSDDDV